MRCAGVDHYTTEKVADSGCSLCVCANQVSRDDIAHGPTATDPHTLLAVPGDDIRLCGRIQTLTVNPDQVVRGAVAYTHAIATVSNRGCTADIDANKVSDNNV